MQKPVLSIGIIFRNDIRCIERCLKALQPLREAVPCELVMADTGSDDGSREIAEKYADIIFDFLWIDDFAAARNAVMDRCSGVWYFSVDTDEYLDADVSELAEFLRSDRALSPVSGAPDFGALTVRNYATYEMDGDYADFLAVRLVRMSTGIRYTGAIHEHFERIDREFPAEYLPQVILHHDGYVEMSGEGGKAKRQRNISLLRKQLEEDPDNLTTLMQFLDCGDDEPDYGDMARHAVKMVLERRQHWSIVGPPIFSNAVRIANKLDLPEADEWIQKAEELFPQSAFIRVDVNFTAGLRCYQQEDYKGMIQRGEAYLTAMEDYQAGKMDPSELLSGNLSYSIGRVEQEMRYCLANAYTLEHNRQRALELLEGVDYSSFDVQHTVSAIQALRNLHFSSDLDTTGAVMAMWRGVTEPKPSAEKAAIRYKAAQGAWASIFSNSFRATEQGEDFHRPSYTMLLPLKELCDLGKAAVVMETTDPTEMEQLLREMEDWKKLPNEVLFHALDYGMAFPLSGQPLSLEEMDALAVRLARRGHNYVALALWTAEQASSGNWQSFVWAHELMLAAVRVWPWDQPDVNEERGMTLVRAFVGLEKEFLSRCYTPEILQEDRLFALPPVHRFGWHCMQAFAALDSGDHLTCVRQLSAGLAACEGMKLMVEFLLKRVEEMERVSRIATAPPELVELAEQVKLMLARFAPDDPAVVELKKSPTYQQVAWLIEKPASMSGTILQ